MSRLFLTAAAVLALAAPAFAEQEHAEHHAALAAADSSSPSHEMCKSVMGRKMDGKAMHDHSRDKTAAPTWPGGKPLSAAEMEQMHKTCAAKMQKADAAPEAK
jgi:hypothetical protein